MTPDGDETARRPKRPKTKARLEQLITQWQKDSGLPVARLNLRIAAMMLAGALARVVDPDDEAVFATKGGIAMELWMGGRARATRDIDIVPGGIPTSSPSSSTRPCVSLTTASPSVVEKSETFLSGPT